jgi:hypothetical protein
MDENSNNDQENPEVVLVDQLDLTMVQAVS